MAFETRKAGDPATAKAPRKRAAARPTTAAEPTTAAKPTTVAEPTTVALEAPAPSVFGSTRPKRARKGPDAAPEVAAASAPSGAALVEKAVTPATESAGGFAARGPGRRRASARPTPTPTPTSTSTPAPASTSTSTPTSVPTPRRPTSRATPLAAVPSVEEPASLLRDDRISHGPADPAKRPPGQPVAGGPQRAAPAPVPAPTPAAPAPVPSAPAVDADTELSASHETVVVSLGGGRYGVAMDAVDEVGRPPSVTRVPGLPAWLAGVANWRGRVLAVVDLRPLLAAPQVPLGRNGRLVVCSKGGVTIGLLTENVEGVVTVERDATEQPLVTLAGQAAQLVAGQVRHARGPIALLDLDAVFALRGQLPRARRAG